MIRALASDEIERVLRAGTVGRIGCHSGLRTYIVPVAYAYKDGAIYAHSAYGQKIEMMRADSRVCFEVDHMEDLVNWTSAICWGTYEELRGEQAQAGLEIIRARLAGSLPRQLDHGGLAAEEPVGDDNVVVYRLNLTETSGREERLHWEMLPVVDDDTHSEACRSMAAESWLTRERASELAEAARAVDAEDICTAADKHADKQISR